MTIVLQIKDIPEGNSKQNLRIPAEGFPLNYNEIRPYGDLVIWSDISRLRDQLVFKGMFSLSVRLICGRCAEEFERKIETELMFVLKFMPGQSRDIYADEASEDFYLLPEGTLEFDYTDILRDKVILNVELKPLCNEDCQGICPVCGRNRNIDPCSCNREKVDERWLPLKDLTDRS